MPGTNGNAAKSFWTPTILQAWSSRQNAIPVTGASDEFFFRLSRIPRRGMECSCTSKHRLYSLMFLWLVLPVTTFIVSVVIGKNDFWGKGKWAFTIFFGAMYMLAEYGTFKMANNIAFNKLNAPDFGMIVAGAIISAIGMLVGSLWNKKRYDQNKKDK